MSATTENLHVLRRRILHEDCRMVIVGDSQSYPTLYRLPGAILRRWVPPLGWSGLWVPAQGFPQPDFWSVETGGAANQTVTVLNSTDVPAFAIGNITQTRSVTLEYSANTTGQYWRTDLAYATSGTYPDDPKFFDNSDPFGDPNRRRSCYVYWDRDNADTVEQFRVWYPGTQSQTVVNMSGSGEGTVGVHNTPGFTGQGNLGRWSHSSTDENGKRLDLLGAFWERVDGSDVRLPGFSFFEVAKPGKGIYEHLHRDGSLTNQPSDSMATADFRAYISSMGGANTAMIVQGHNGESADSNGSASDDLTRYQNNLPNLIEQLSADMAATGVPVIDQRFLLVLPWHVDSKPVASRRDATFDIRRAGTTSVGPWQIAVLSLLDYYGVSTNPMLGGGDDVHPESWTEATMVAEDMFNLIQSAAAPTRRVGEMRLRGRRLALPARPWM